MVEELTMEESSPSESQLVLRNGGCEGALLSLTCFPVL